MRRLAALLVLLLAPPAPAGDDPVFTGPAGEYRVTAPGPVRVVRGATFITFAWGDGPAPGPVGPPGPVPGPGPVTPPGPPPAPWGPAERILILYESDVLTGREPIYSPVVRDALTAAVPLDAAQVPRWRAWDNDLVVAGEPDWVPAMEKARAFHADDMGPVLFAFDARGAMRPVPVGVRPPAELAAEIRALAAPPGRTP